MRSLYQKSYLLLLSLLAFSFASLAQPTFTVTDIKDACDGSNNGELRVTVASGTAPYQIIVFGNSTAYFINEFFSGDTTLTSLAPDTYDIRVRSAEGNSAPRQVTISSVSGVNIDSFVTNDNTCNGASDGSIDLTVSGGSGSYTYSLDGGANFVTGPTITGLSAGSYTVDIFDENTNCSVSQAFTIADELTLTGAAPAPLCASDPPVDLTAYFTPSVTGGSYVFTGSGVSGNNFNPAAAGAGTFSIDATYSVNGCTATASILIEVTIAPTLSAALTNVSCFEADNGEIDLTISGGTAPYTISWQDGSGTNLGSSEDLSGLEPGSYTVTVTDANSCPVTETYLITEPAKLVVFSFETDVACFGNSSGEIQINRIEGGTAPFDLVLENSGGTPVATANGVAAVQTVVFNNLPADPYTLIVNDANGCILSRVYNITEPAAALAASATAADASCNAAADGSVDLSVSGGTAPYTYSWNNGAASEDLASITAGTYTVTVTDANGCTTPASATVGEPAAIAITVDSQGNATTCGGSEGFINVSVSGGTGAYTYAWSSGQNSEDLSGLSAGSYTLDVTDANGCTQTSSAIVIGEPAGISSLTASLTDINCFGGSTGAIDLTVSGGTAPYTYSWDNGATTQDLSGLSAGTYQVTVTDANSCELTQSFTLSQPAAALALSGTTTDVACNGDTTGEIDLSVSGGTTPYTYNWSSGATSQDLTNLGAGSYSVTVTDANGCTQNQSFTINAGTTLILNTVVDNEVSCNGASDGEASVAITSGGVAPFTYAWSNGANTASVSGLTAGTYTVTVTDANGCAETASVSLAEPAALVVNDVTSNNVTTCGGADGSIAVSVSGGTGALTYSWDDGANGSSRSGLSAGTYGLTVSDANGCSISISPINLSEPAGISSLTASLTDINCFGGSTGAIDLTVSGGTAPYTYSWDNGATTQNLSGLSAGTYTVTVTDDNNCQLSQSFTLSQPAAALALSGTTTDVACNGDTTGEIDLSVSGGTAPYTYSWSNGASSQDLTNLGAGSYSVTVTDANGCNQNQSFTINPGTEIVLSSSINQQISCFGGNGGEVEVSVTSGGTAPFAYAWNTGATTSVVSGLTAGSYSVTVTDANGCSQTASITLTEPTELNLNVSSTNITTCGASDGTITASASGGTGAITYSWSDGPTGSNRTGLAAGSYQVTATDANGCSVSSATIEINEPAGISSINLLAQINVSCFGGADGALSVEAAGGSGSYTYSWNTGENTASISGLVAGTYTVTATDGNGCIFSESFTITQPAAALAASASATDASCNAAADGSVDLSVSGGTAPYTYSWNNGAASEDLASITAGTYTVTVTDANGCTTPASATVGEPAAIAITVDSQGNATSCGGSEGFINVSVGGGTGAYTYAWSSGQNSEDLSGLSAGSYTLDVTDANGCTQTSSAIVIGEPAGISSLTASLTDINCFGGSTGAIDLTVSGGTAPYTYSWDNGATTQDLSGLSAGTYQVTVTDANSCELTQSFTLSQPAAALSLNASQTNESSCNANDGTIVLSPAGGTAPIDILWTDGSTELNRSGLAPGDYTVTATDANACTLTETYTIAPGGDLVINLVSVSAPNCFGEDTGAIDIEVSNGQAPYTYDWNSGAFSTQDLSGVAAGAYNLVVTDANGCGANLSVEITQPDQLLLTETLTQISCNGANDGSIVASATGGSGSLTYSWADGTSGASRTDLAPGTYTLTVTDANSCNVVRAYEITEPAAISVVVATTEPTCNGEVNGQIELATTGGSGALTVNWDTGASGNVLSGIGAGNYTATISDATGCSIDTLISLGEPAAISFTAVGTDPTSCAAPNGTIEVSAAGGSQPYLYNIVEGNQQQSESTFTSLAAGTYNVFVTDAQGCSSDTTLIELKGTGFTMDLGPDVAVCSPNTVSLDAGLSSPEDYEYNWSTGETTASITVASSGTYSLTARNTTTGCEAFDVVEVTISDSFSPEITSLTTTEELNCATTEITLVANIANAGANPTYIWSRAGVILRQETLAASSDQLTLTDFAQGDVIELEVRTEEACGGVTNASFTIDLPALEAPVASLLSPADICLGDAIEATATGENLSWTLSLEGNIVHTATGENFAFTPSEGGSYQLSVTQTPTGCGQSPAVSFNVNVSAIAAPALSQSNVTTCEGSAVSVSASGTNLVWYQADQLTIVTAGPDLDLSTLPAGDYTFYAQDSLNGCYSPFAELSVSIGESFTFDLGENVETCEPATITLNTGLSAADGYTFNWSTGETTASIEVSSSGLYTVDVTNAAGCVVSDAVEVTIASSIVPSVALSASALDCESTELTLTVTDLVGEGTNPTYVWMRNGELLAGEVSASLTTTEFAEGDQFSVEMISSLPCASPATASAEFTVEPIGATAPVITGAPATVCTDEPQPTLTTQAGASVAWFVNGTETDNFSGIVAAEFVPTMDVEGSTYTFYAVDTTRNCGVLISEVVSIEYGPADCTPACPYNPQLVLSQTPNGPICADISSIYLQADTVEVGPGASIEWFRGAESISTEFAFEYSPVIPFTNGEEIRAVVSINDALYQCDGTKLLVEETITLEVVESVDATLEILSSVEEACYGSDTPITLRARGSYADLRGVGMTTTFNWYYSNGTTEFLVKSGELSASSSDGNLLEVNADTLVAGHQFRVEQTVPSSLGCVNPPAPASYVVPQAAVVNPTIVLSTEAICSGETALFTASVQNAGSNPTIEFSVDGLVASSGTSTVYALTNAQPEQVVTARVIVNNADGQCLGAREGLSQPLSPSFRSTQECQGVPTGCGPFEIEVTQLVRPSCNEENGLIGFRIRSSVTPYTLTYSLADRVISERTSQVPYTFTVDNLKGGDTLRVALGDDGCEFMYVIEEASTLTASLEKNPNGDVQCFGEKTGSVRLTVGGGMAPYQYKVGENGNWLTMAGNVKDIFGLPAGVTTVSVRQSEADECYATDDIEIFTVNPQLQLTAYSIVQEASCNGNDGIVSLDAISGGNGGPYQVKLIDDANWLDFEAGMQLSELSRGRQVLLIRDGICETSTTLIVPSPGAISLSQESGVVPFSCDNPEVRNMIFLKIDEELTEVAPAYIAEVFKVSNDGSDPVFLFETESFVSEMYIQYLEQGDYQINLRSVRSEGCPETKVFSIQGSEIPVPVAATVAPVDIFCANTSGGLYLTDIAGASGLPYEIQVYTEEQEVINDEPIRRITLSSYDYQVRYQNQGYWMVEDVNPGIYQVVVVQDQGLCGTLEVSPINQVIVREIENKLAAEVVETKLSLPEIATGAISFEVRRGSGTAPYTASLVWKDRVEGQEDWYYESYGDRVEENNTTGLYTFTYEDVPPGIYELSVTDDQGCTYILEVTLDFDRSLFVPNVITPNGDGYNETLYIRNRPERTQLVITNRWGKIVYQSENYQNDWDGQNLPEGVYYYQVAGQGIEGGTLQGWVEIKRGAAPQ